MNILITGATGFIGKELVKELSREGGHEIYCLVRNYQKAEALKSIGAKLIYADITREHTLSKIVRYKIDVLYHCAAYVGNTNKELLEKVNIEGTRNICQLAQHLNVDRMVYLSSVAVITGNTQVPLTEDLPYAATNPYGESKIEAEKIVVSYRERGLKAVILRPCMVYGRGEPHLLPLVCRLLKLSLLPLIEGGQKKLHLVYIKNVTAAMIYCLRDERFLESSYFVADDEVLRVKEIFKIIIDTLGTKEAWNLPAVFKVILLKVPFIGRKLGFFLKDRVYSTKKLKSLGFKPPHEVKEALSDSARLYKT